MKRFIFVFASFLPLVTFGQIQLERQVISSVSIQGSGSIIFSSTGGQVEHTTGNSDDVILTQGFEQPTSKTREISYLYEFPECANGDPYILLIELDSVCGNGIGDIYLDGILEDEEIELTESGEYELTIECESGSNFNELITFEEPILGPCDLGFYNVITPSLELNYWHIDNIQTDQFISNEVIIFNRWGDEVWKGSNYDNSAVRWEGKKMDGDDLPQGTYYYLVQIGNDTFKGFIELIK